MKEKENEGEKTARNGKNNNEDNLLTMHLIVFKVGKEEFAIRIEQVKEVNLTPDIAKVPRTPQFIKGVANIRGDIIAIMDLEERFGLRHEADNTGGSPLSNITYTLVIEGEEYTIGLLVRDVPQSLNVPVNSIDRSPSLLQAINVSDSFIDGIAKMGSRLIVILDMERILTLEEIAQLPTT